MNTSDREEIVESLAYDLWIRRGKPIGSPGLDWDLAEQMYEELPLGEALEQILREVVYFRTAAFAIRSRQ